MPNNADNVFVSGGNGAIAHAPLGTSVPTDFYDALNQAFNEVGYVNEDGVTEKEGIESKKITAWQNGDTVRTVQTAHALTYELTMLERNDETIAIAYGNGNAASHKINGEAKVHEVYVIDCLDGNDVVRIVIPDGQVVDKKEVAYKGLEATAYGVTIEAYPDANGDKAFIYSGTDLS